MVLVAEFLKGGKLAKVSACSSALWHCTEKDFRNLRDVLFLKSTHGVVIKARMGRLFREFCGFCSLYNSIETALVALGDVLHWETAKGSATLIIGMGMNQKKMWLVFV